MSNNRACTYESKVADAGAIALRLVKRVPVPNIHFNRSELCLQFAANAQPKHALAKFANHVAEAAVTDNKLSRQIPSGLMKTLSPAKIPRSSTGTPETLLPSRSKMPKLRNTRDQEAAPPASKAAMEPKLR